MTLLSLLCFMLITGDNYVVGVTVAVAVVIVFANVIDVVVVVVVAIVMSYAGYCC